VRDNSRQTVEDQYDAVCETAKSIAGMQEHGFDVVVTHGNGPQVGCILRRSDIAYETAGMHRVPLVSCIADTQGAIGYHIQQALDNEFFRQHHLCVDELHGVNLAQSTILQANLCE